MNPNDPKFTIERSTGSKKSFFEELAERLREMWPPGEKDGKYPWRDSVGNLARRLELLWADRFPSVDKGDRKSVV